jgi:fructan beta-fructosidase
MKLFLLTIALSLTSIVASAQPIYHEKYRPQLHFSPQAHWMNDPNGMVYVNGTYHLFFQYYPDSSVWGPMHWGHAISTDLLHWRQEPIALYPDSLGYIFSGSAVLDKNNTSGFGKAGQPPLVAIFTQHDPIGAKQNRNDYQTQSIAYSLDNGRTWTKYAHNPVIKNPGITDFRDPKVSWYEPAKTWIMTLAVKDKVFFYSSPDLKNWRLNSEFGHDAGAHGGVWECPDLFAIDYQGRAVWVLIVNINPGGPNGGSATQYFLGDFDGKKFTAGTPRTPRTPGPIASTAGTRWLDYGPDEYAGVTWSNTGARKIFLGWMSNWLYGQSVPTSPWRSATTLPRQLGLQRVKDSLYLTEQPVKELAKITSPLFNNPHHITTPLKLDLSTGSAHSFAISFSNDAGENTTLGYDKDANQYYIDRTHSGLTNFSKDFAGRYTAPRIADSGKITLTIYADASSFELFADGGLTTMTALVFPSHPYTKMEIHSADGSRPESLTLSNLKSIWK